MTQSDRLDRAGVCAIQEALQMHKRLGNAVAASIDGKVTWIAPEDIPDAPRKIRRAPAQRK